MNDSDLYNERRWEASAQTSRDLSHQLKDWRLRRKKAITENNFHDWIEASGWIDVINDELAYRRNPKFVEDEWD